MNKKIIIVTGASSGMGKEFLLQISEKEKVDEIWAIARRRERLNDLAKVVDTKIKVLPLDLSLDTDLKKYKNQLEKEKPEIVILANCAGFGKFDHTENIDLETKLNMIDLNVKASVAICDYSIPYMKNGSKIMNISSCSAFQPVPYINTYAATKSFLLSYSRSLNVELKYKGIHVLAVCPFWTKTEFFDRAITSSKEVVINYSVMYDPSLVMKKAIKDLYNPKKDISVYGKMNFFQMILTKLLPHKLVMKVWMKQQKFNGTPDIR